ncbi:hypothetical protein ACLKA7_009953 [Drosophila subpalustris]
MEAPECDSSENWHKEQMFQSFSRLTLSNVRKCRPNLTPLLSPSSACNVNVLLPTPSPAPGEDKRQHHHYATTPDTCHINADICHSECRSHSEHSAATYGDGQPQEATRVCQRVKRSSAQQECNIYIYIKKMCNVQLKACGTI